MIKEVIFHYGALSDPLEQQANAQGLTLGDEAKQLQDLNRCMVKCWLHGLCTDSQKDAMTKKMQKKVTKALKPIETED